MSKKVYKKKYLEDNVMDLALARTAEAFRRYDKVVVSFSGGKDSTAVLNVALRVAREMNRLPLDVVFFDEEAINPETVNYCMEVASWPDVRFHWYCLPIKHRNACSSKHPYWYCWHPEERYKWVREMPPNAITNIPGFKWNMQYQDAAQLLFPGFGGSMIQLLGLRAQESMMRYRSVSKKAHDNWLSSDKRFDRGYPVYDWVTEDIWLAVKTFGWQYNKIYDIYEKMGVPWSSQRIGQAYGEEPLRGLHMYAEANAELWHKMVVRVHGVATAMRYGKTDLYSADVKEYPDRFTSWKEYLEHIVRMYPNEERTLIQKTINDCIRTHQRRSTLGIPDSDNDPVSGCSYQFLCRVAKKGDFKGRLTGLMDNYTAKEKEFVRALKLYGTEAYKNKKLAEMIRLFGDVNV